MKSLKMAFLLLAGVGMFQFTQAQTAQLQNFAPCQVKIDLTWDLSVCSGSLVSTSNTLNPGNFATVTAPAPGAKVVRYDVTYSGSPTATTIASQYCNGGPGGGSVPSSGCGGGGGLVSWDDNFGSFMSPQQIWVQ